MEDSTKDSGIMTNDMETATKSTLTVIITKDNSKWAEPMEMVATFGLLASPTMATGIKD